MMSGNLSAASSLTSLNADANPRCATHRKGLKFFCCKHELLLCSVCAVKKHRSCEEVLTINEASEDKKAEGKKILDVYNQRIALVENAIVERKAAKKLLDTNVQEIQNEIHHVTQRLVDLVKHEERALMQTLIEMQSKETDSLEKDIGNLQLTCSTVRDLHSGLSQSLRLSDVDVIHAVIKEKQQSEERSNVENVVKKRFREIDFKFVASPHVLSFLKHFKTLGQVMVSEESDDGQKSTSSLSSALSDLQSSPVSKRAIEYSRNDQQTSTLRQNPNQLSSVRNTDDDSHLTARERWVRDRTRHLQLKNQNTSQNVPSLTVQTSNPTRPIRALPRPATPDVHAIQRAVVPKRDFTDRPMSTPPMEVSSNLPNQNGFDSSQWNTFRQQSHAQNNHTTSPVSPRNRVYGQNRNHDVNYQHQGYPAHVFQQKDSTEYDMKVEKTRVRSPGYSHHVASPVVAIKEEDNSFGRSFAAVQITNTQAYGKFRNEDCNSIHVKSVNTSSGQSDERQVDDEQADIVFTGHPPSYSKAIARRTVTDHLRAFERARSPVVENHGNLETDEEKERRWIHRTAFTSTGPGIKRLLCGVGVMQDGRLILVDQEHYTVQLFDQYHRFVTEAKLDSRPYDVTVLKDNKIGVSLQTERTIKFFIVTSDTLTPVADLGVPCEMVCYGICHGNGCYCVCCGDEVWILSDEGRVVNRIRNDKAGNSLFVQAEYVTMDTSGSTMFVSDAGNNKVLAMNIDGRRLWEFTYQGFKPSGIKCVDRYLYICDRDQHRILMLNLEGHVVKQSVIGRVENPRALAINATGNVMYVTQMRYDAIVSPAKPVQVFCLQ